MHNLVKITVQNLLIYNKKLKKPFNLFTLVAALTPGVQI